MTEQHQTALLDHLRENVREQFRINQYLSTYGSAADEEKSALDLERARYILASELDECED